MDVFEAVRTVLAVRQYDSRPVPRETIDRIVEAGRLTASSMNRQPWHFVVVTEREGLERLAELVRTGQYVREAAFAIAVGAERDSIFAVSDASRAIQSMILTAWDEGVGSNWTGFRGLDDARTALGISEDYDVVAVLPFGYPAEERRAGKKARKPIGEVASSERFGTPYAPVDR
ncbi:MAG: nitroreductase family protein [Actinomycetota bacterium]